MREGAPNARPKTGWWWTAGLARMCRSGRGRSYVRRLPQDPFRVRRDHPEVAPRLWGAVARLRQSVAARTSTGL